MIISSEKTTIYLDPKVKKSVQYYALRDDSSLSKIINDRLSDYLEDMADTTAEPLASSVQLEEVVALTQKLIKRHEKALKNLSQR